MAPQDYGIYQLKNHREHKGDRQLNNLGYLKEVFNGQKNRFRAYRCGDRKYV